MKRAFESYIHLSPLVRIDPSSYLGASSDANTVRQIQIQSLQSTTSLKLNSQPTHDISHVALVRVRRCICEPGYNPPQNFGRSSPVIKSNWSWAGLPYQRIPSASLCDPKLTIRAQRTPCAFKETQQNIVQSGVLPKLLLSHLINNRQKPKRDIVRGPRSFAILPHWATRDDNLASPLLAQSEPVIHLTRVVVDFENCFGIPWSEFRFIVVANSVTRGIHSSKTLWNKGWLTSNSTSDTSQCEGGKTLSHQVQFLPNFYSALKHPSWSQKHQLSETISSQRQPLINNLQRNRRESTQLYSLVTDVN